MGSCVTCNAKVSSTTEATKSVKARGAGSSLPKEDYEFETILDPENNLSNEYANQAAALILEGRRQSGALATNVEDAIKTMKKTFALVLVTLDKNVVAMGALKTSHKLDSTDADGIVAEIGLLNRKPGVKGINVGSVIWNKLYILAKESNLDAVYTETIASNYASLKTQIEASCVKKSEYGHIPLGFFQEEWTSPNPTADFRSHIVLVVTLFPLTALMAVTEKAQKRFSEFYEKEGLGHFEDNGWMTTERLTKIVENDPTMYKKKIEDGSAVRNIKKWFKLMV